MKLIKNSRSFSKNKCPLFLVKRVNNVEDVDFYIKSTDDNLGSGREKFMKETYEKLYEENNNIAQEINNPEVQEKLRQKGFDFGKKLKTVTTIGTISGAVIPAVIAICTKGKIWKRALFGTLSSLVGAAIGAWGSTFMGVRVGLRGIFKTDENLKEMDEIAKQVDALGVERKVETIV